jgi:hypothetical protein
MFDLERETTGWGALLIVSRPYALVRSRPVHVATSFL